MWTYVWSLDCILELLDIVAFYFGFIIDISMWHFIDLVFHPWYSFFCLVESVGDTFPVCLLESSVFLNFCTSLFQDQNFLSEDIFHVTDFFIHSVDFGLHAADFFILPDELGPRGAITLIFYTIWLHYCWNEHLIKDLWHIQFLIVCDEIITLFPPLRVPGIELKSLDLVVSTFTHWAISLASADSVQYVFRSFCVTKNDWPSELRSYFLKQKHQPWCQEN